MPRKKSATVAPSFEVTPEQTPGIERGQEAANTMAAVQHQYNDERDIANQLWGQIQMADAISKLTTVVGLTKLAHIKETKLYRAFAGKKAVDRDGNEITDVGTWGGFCRAIGTSANKVDEDLLNLRTFGEEAMGNLTRIGAGYRELRQYRRLPADERLALIEAAKDGDKDDLLDLAESLIAKHAKEKEELTAELADVKGNYDAQGEVIRKKDEKLNAQEKQIHKLQKRVETADPDEQAKQLRDEVSLFAFEAEAAILGKLTPGFEALAAHADANNCTHEEFMAGCLCQIERALIGLRNRFNVKDKPNGDEMPDWLRPGAEEAANKQIAETMAKSDWEMIDGVMTPKSKKTASGK